MTFRILLSSIAILTATLLPAQSINGEKSEATFAISNLGFNTVKGSLTGMSGKINFDPNNIEAATFNVCVKVNTIQSGIGKRDEHLKSEDFFDANKYPDICFKSTSVSKTELGYSTTGNLSLHGVTQTITIPFTYSDNTLTGSFTINRLDYKVGADTGTFTAGDEVEIGINCVIE